MQHKLRVLFATLILFSLLIVPAGSAQAQVQAQAVPADCPSYEPGLLKERDVLRSLPLECIREYKEAARESSPSTTQETDLQTKAVGGPDGFGYTYNDSVAYSWISATTNSGLTGYDQFAGPINIGFNFPFYGMPQSQLYFNTNGLITFGVGSSSAGAYGTSEGVEPNNLIAPFWDYLVVGSPYNSGAIYYSQGGTAPNRYFVVEWRNIELDYGSSPTPFSFEAVLYENGDIVFQYQSLPSSFWVNYVGIEDSVGLQRLEYPGTLSPSKAIRFYYPNTSTARLLVSPLLQAGGFAPLNGYKVFPIKVINPGTLGADTYDLSKSSAWPVTFYASNGLTPLTDTDGDGLIDTSPLPQGTSTTVMARVSTPNGAQVGANNMATVTITSSLNASKTKTIYLFTNIPANFASVFQDEANGAMSFMTVDPYGTSTSKATADRYFGNDIAVTKITNNNYFYIWYKHYFDGNTAWGDIEYALLGRTGNIIRPVTTLTNDSSVNIINYDFAPTVAMAPDGTVGVAWIRQKNNISTGKFNYNVYFATLNTSGSLLTGPTDITNNTIWSTISDPVIIRFRNPTIAASDDNRFVIGWTKYTRTSGAASDYDVWYAIRNTAGANVYSPHALTDDHVNYTPVLNSLTGGKVIMTWHSDYFIDPTPQYSVINSNGSVLSLPWYDFGPGVYASPDAVQLPNGKVAIAWPTYTGVAFVILNSSYNPESGDSASTPDSIWGDVLSVATDASNHVIMTWTTEQPYNTSYYALGDSTGNFVTPPMIYKMSGNFVENSHNGQGIAPYEGGNPIEVNIGGVVRGSYGLIPTESRRVSYQGLNNGPALIESKNAIPALAAERVIYKVNNINTSFTEMMALPKSQLDTTYWLPWYNNVDLDTQLRFANVSNSTTAVQVWIGGSEMEGSPFTLLAGESTRKSFPGINKGPVKIASDQNIVAAARVIYKVNGINTSFSEMMALPNSQLDTTYWLPWYNNRDLDTQLRFANVMDQPASVHVYIGGDEMDGSPFMLAAGESTRKSFPGVNAGPVQIVSDQNIVAAERVIYKVNGVNTSFSEMMALPNSQLDTTYWLPWYNNRDLDTQLRIANVTDQPATVTVSIGGVAMPSFDLAAGASTRLSFPSTNNGPVKIESTQTIVAAERVIYKINNIATSFSEMMGLPNSQIDMTYWLPWYNNVDLDTQLRFGIP